MKDSETARARVVGFSLITLFLVWGFLVTYLASRTLVRKFFARLLDEEAVRRISLKASREAQEQEEQRSRADAGAFVLTDRALKPGAGSPAVTQAELTEAMKKASERTRAQIFNTASSFRSANNLPGAKEKMARAAMVFQALIEADPEANYHRPRAELGYIFKDSTQPDWGKAEE
ncbi:hypothetical protein ACH5A3_31620 [Streptomyces echinatus]|uniref:hypothetical protein n=1 Tax=Streptomyces echinatus TaxID=67293 RepID=UPI0037BC015F